MKTIFFVGKGGVGKSTLSATAAWQLADSGKRVFVFSLDPAHNLGDIYGVRLGGRKRRIHGRLDAAEADLDRAATRHVKENVELLTRIYSYTKAFNLDLYFKILRYSPGVEEYAALSVLEEVLRTEVDYDFLVFDTPPTALTLRILALPKIAVTWIERLERIRREILKKRYTIHRIAGETGEGELLLSYREEDDEVIRQLGRLHGRYHDLYARLKGQDNTVAVVFNPDFLSRRETERIIEGLRDLEIPIRAGFDNKYSAEGDDVAGEVEHRLFGDRPAVPIVRVPIEDNSGGETFRMPVSIAATFLG